MDFKAELQAFRAEHGLNQASLAEIVGVSHRTLWAWETGEAVADIKVNGARFAMQAWAAKNKSKRSCKVAKVAK